MKYVPLDDQRLITDLRAVADALERDLKQKDRSTFKRRLHSTILMLRRYERTKIELR